ncbi:MAG: hypothetical protein IT245_01425 [Bacteroidia bacterium]|nr:hypothetical protein [Bacteroidia bacterium]
MRRLKLLLLFVCIANVLTSKAKIILHPVSEFGFGVDMSQFNYYLTSHRVGLNLGVGANYKPFQFLKFNVAGYINDVSDMRGNYFSQLESYRSIGNCVKLGPELSIKVSQSPRNKRLTWGYDFCLLNFREQGRFELNDTYWDPYNLSFNTGTKSHTLTQFTIGYQQEWKHIQFKLQLYEILEKSSSKIDRNNSVLEDYDPMFVPGFGYKRAGINVFIYYRFY